MSAIGAIGAEVVIVGGGIAGTSAAYHLAVRRRDVVLLERGDLASGASGVNAGMIDSIGWGDVPDLQAHLTAGSLELFTGIQLDAGEEIELRQSGGLQVIQTPEQYDHVRQRVTALRARGHQVELLGPRDARRLEPGLGASVLGAMYAPLRAQADPERATRAFARLAERHRARMLTGHEVTAIEPRASGGWLMRTARLEVVAGALVIAAGAWSRRVGAMIGLDIPIVPVRGQMWATSPLPPRVFHTISSAESSLAWRGEEWPSNEPPDLTHRGSARVTRHLYGRQRWTGDVIFGGDRELAADETAPDPDGIEVNRAHAIEVLPFLHAAPIARTWAGLMPFSLDGKPLIGRIPGRDDLWIVGGLASSGFGRGPMAGKLLAEALDSGKTSPVLAEADPARCVREAVARD